MNRQQYFGDGKIVPVDPALAENFGYYAEQMRGIFRG